MEVRSSSKENQGFLHRIIKSYREYYGISQSDLCSGLYTNSMMNRIEQGERVPGKMNRDMLLGRLGISCERLEEYLSWDEYRQMQIKNHILICIQEGNYIEAKKALIRMERGLNNEQRAARQFCLVMRAELAIKSGKSKAEDNVTLLEKAVSLTMGQYLMEEAWRQKDMVLSIQEANVLLEYLHVAEDKKGNDPLSIKQKYLYLIDRIEQSIHDDTAKAKFIPKAIYYYFRFIEGKDTVEIAVQDYVSYGERARERMNRMNQTYYYADILKIIITRLKNELKRQLHTDREQDWCRNVLLKLEKEAAVINSRCDPHKVAESEAHNGIFYRDTHAVFAGDAIKTRREMLHISREKLCSEICDEKTLRRLEHGKSNTNYTTIRKLLERLKISSDFCRFHILTEKKDVLDLHDMASAAMEKGKWETAAELITEIERKTLPPLTDNIQFLKALKMRCMLEMNVTATEEYIQGMMRTLEMTISKDEIHTAKDIFLSRREIMLMHSIYIKADDKAKKTYKHILEKSREWYQNHECSNINAQLFEENGQISQYIYD